MRHSTENIIENNLIVQLKKLGYYYVELSEYPYLVSNFRKQLALFNSEKLFEAKGIAEFSDAEFERIMIYVDNHTVYDSAKILREKFILDLDNGKSVYIEFFSSDVNRNIYQVTHQVTIDPEHRNDVVYRNRYDVTILVNGLPLTQIELKNTGVEINEAINQINRYRKFSFKGLFNFIQLFVVSNSSQTKYFCNENIYENGVYNPILKSLVFFWTKENNERINKLTQFTDSFLTKMNLTEMIDKFMIIKSSEPTLMVMRPHQIYAVKAARKRVLETNQNGYVFATTGSGKTLTSFKLSDLLQDERSIDKVVFLVDRKDLDDQTISEFNSFEKDCVDFTDSVHVLIKQFKDTNNKFIVTTIQKLSNAVKSERYRPVLDIYRDKKVVFIIDECHRSQFGLMHKYIEEHFKNANYIGFTGTPIMEENRGENEKTTADVFSGGTSVDGKLRNACLHKYSIADAIADGCVLGLSVEYQRTIFAKDVEKLGLDPDKIDDPIYCKENNIDIEDLYHDKKRIQKIAKHIFDHHERHMHPMGKDVYTALFAVDSIRILGEYYDEFKKLNETREKKYKVAAIFSFNPNEDMDEAGDEHSSELLARCIKDYNEIFGTSFSVKTFDAYRKDVMKRMKQKDEQIDILLVVDMMLTGFDSKVLNTLYLDKNLTWHNLVQAFSRTNRVDKKTKRFGHIVTFRNIKKWQDDAFSLFSDGNPDAYLIKTYDFYVNEWRKQNNVVRSIVPKPEDAGHLRNEDQIRSFVLAFRDMIHTLATLTTFTGFDWKDLEDAMSEEEFYEYKSWYLSFRSGGSDKERILIDVDFDVELVRTDKINVVYILNLLKKAKKEKKSEEEKKKDVESIIREIERSDNESVMAKKEIMKEFALTALNELPDDADIMAEFDEFTDRIRKQEIEEFAIKSEVDTHVVHEILSEYLTDDGLSKEEMRTKLKNLGFGLIKTDRLVKKIDDFAHNIVFKYEAQGDIYGN